MIKKIILKNFQLFKDQTIDLDRINLITGLNYDSLDEEGVYSGNGSGKTTILSAILFGLFGEVTDIKLSELLRNGTKEASVNLQFSVGKDNYRIIRKIPNSLQLFKGEEEIKFNTTSFCQMHIQSLLETNFQHYRTYNLIDNHKGINLLDLGNITLRKSLMQFCDEQFSEIRKSLLAKKLERENYNVDKRLYTFALSDRRIDILNKGLDDIKESYTTFEKDRNIQQGITNKIKTEIQTRERIISNRRYELQEAQKSGVCPILKTKCLQITKQITPEQQSKINLEITTQEEEIKVYKLQLDNEVDALEYYDSTLNKLQIEEQKARQCLMKMKEALKFSSYKYTRQDVLLYEEAIKTLDSFSAHFIKEWLENLSIIINSLLKGLNLSVEFSVEKDFIKLRNNGQELSYSQISGGQRKFLGVIFKLGILLQEGVNSGVLLFDEGLGEMDFVNLYKLIDVLKGLNFQSIIIYQNCPKEIKDVNYLNVERKDGISHVN